MAKKKNNKKPAHEVIVKRIIDDFGKKRNKKLLIYGDGGDMTTMINHHYCCEIKALLGILKEMIIPDTAESLKQLIDGVDLSKLDSPASIKPIFQQLKKLQP